MPNDPATRFPIARCASRHPVVRGVHRRLALARRQRPDRRSDRQRRPPLREGRRRHLLRHRLGDDDGRRELADHRHRHRSDRHRLRDHAGRGAGAGRRPQGDHRQAGQLRRSTRTITTITRSATRSSGPTSRSSATRTRASGCSATRMEQYTYLTSVEPVPARVEALRKRIADEKDPQQKATARAAGRQLAGLSRAGQGDQGHAAERDARPEDDAVSRRPRDPDPVLRPRPHRHRRRRLPAEGEDRLHRRPDGVGHLLHGRRLRGRVAGDARSADDAGLRHRDAGARRRVQGQGAHRGVPALPARSAEAGARAEEGRRRRGCRRAADRHARVRADFPQIRAAGVDPAAVRRIYALADHPEPCRR